MPDPAQPANTPSPLHVDSDWKAQAQAEREKLSKQEAERAARAEQEGEGLPPAEFRSLVGLLASQAVMGLGTMGDAQGRLIVDLAGSKFAIDLLDVLQQKTKGNLTPEEATELDEVQRELKMRFLQVARMVTEQMARGQSIPTADAGTPAVAPAAAPPKPAGGSGASKLIIP